MIYLLISKSKSTGVSIDSVFLSHKDAEKELHRIENLDRRLKEIEYYVVPYSTANICVEDVLDDYINNIQR